MTFVVDHHMLRLQIPVDYQVAVQVLKRAKDFSHIEVHVVFDSFLVASYPTKQVTPFDEIHQNVHAFLVMEACIGLYNEVVVVFWVAQVHEHFLLTDDVLGVLATLYMGLVDLFDSEFSLSFLVDGADDNTKRTRSDPILHLEIVSFGLVFLFDCQSGCAHLIRSIAEGVLR